MRLSHFLERTDADHDISASCNRTVFEWFGRHWDHDARSDDHEWQTAVFQSLRVSGHRPAHPWIERLYALPQQGGYKLPGRATESLALLALSGHRSRRT